LTGKIGHLASLQPPVTSIQPKAAWRPQPNSVLPARGGLCPRAAIKCGRIARRPPPGSGYCLLKAARNPYRPAWLASLAWRAG